MGLKSLSAAVLAASCLFMSMHLAAQAPDGEKILAEIDQIRFPQAFSMRITLTTVTQGEDDKVMVIDVTHKTPLGSFLDIRSPVRSKGTRMLTEEGSLWMYNPRSGSTKPLRLSPRDAFQGSAFSNSDVSNTTFLDQYKGVFEAEETVDTPEFGRVEAWRIRAEATTPEAAYGKIVMWVRKSDLLPLKFDYYAKSGLLFRKMVLSGYKVMAGRLRASKMTMVSMDQTGTRSILTIDQMRARKDIPDALFNLNELTR